MSVKALTLTQPWATLVALGEKEIETRSWRTHYRGPLLIHASKALPKSWSFMREEHFINVLEPLVGLNDYGVPNIERLPRGEIVAHVMLADVVPMKVDVPPFYAPEGFAISPQEFAFGNYGPGRWAWVLEDVSAMRRGYPAKGRQGLWNFPLVEWFTASNMLLARPLSERDVRAALEQL